MNKIVIPAAVMMMSIFATACSGSHSEAAHERSFSEKIENCTDTDSLRSYVTEAKDYASKLVDEGKYQEANAFIDSISPVLEAKAPALMGAFVAVRDRIAVEKTTAEAKEKIGEAADSISDKAGKAADAVQDAAGKLGDKAQEAVDKATGSVKDAAGKAVDSARDKAKDLAGKAADKL